MAQPSPFTGRLAVPGTIVSDYILRGPEGREPGEGSELIVLLHGYSLTARSLFDWLAPVLPKGATIFAPNGPYPLPEKVEDGYRVGFSWYFYSYKEDAYLYDESNSASLIREGVERLGLAHLPKRVIGYSQGGYLSPMVAASLTGVKQVIGVACRFEDVKGVPSYRMDAVHGEKDESVDFEPSLQAHRDLVSRGVRGEFFAEPSSSHRMSREMIALVGKALSLP
jgi:predicted esterase